MIVYGAGAHLRDVLDWHPDIARHIVRIFDKNPEQARVNFYDMSCPIEEPDGLYKMSPGTLVAIAAVQYYREIVEELRLINPWLRFQTIDDAYVTLQSDVWLRCSAGDTVAPKVSIIIPTLNVAPYIRECMDSVCGQTLQDIEIICVDGQSEDGTLEILREYQKKDSRIQLIISPFKSVGYQENLGIEAAVGKYVGFVESDDFVDIHMFEYLYNAAENLGVDIVKANHICFAQLLDGSRFEWQDRVLGRREVVEYYGKVLRPAVYPEILIGDHCMWNGIYRRDFIEKYHIRLNTTPGASYQDMGFIFQTLLQAERAVYLDLYFYYYRNGIATQSVADPKGLQRLYPEFQFCAEILQRLQADETCWWSYYFKLTGPSLTRRIETLLLSTGNGALSGEMKAAIVPFRDEIREALAGGRIPPTVVGQATYAEICLFVRDMELYLAKARELVRVRHEYMLATAQRLKQAEEVVIFGIGCDACRLLFYLEKQYGAKNVKAFAWLETNEWGKEQAGRPILSPQQAVEEHPGAVFVIMDGFRKMRTLRWLLENGGIERDRILLYGVTGYELN